MAITAHLMPVLDVPKDFIVVSPLPSLFSPVTLNHEF